MGKSTTPKYILKITTFKSQNGLAGYSNMEWNCRQSGRPSAANIDKWVTVYENSCLPGGCNAHLGYDPVLSCEVRRNPGDVVASWSRKEYRKDEPLFQTV